MGVRAGTGAGRVATSVDCWADGAGTGVDVGETVKSLTALFESDAAVDSEFVSEFVSAWIVGSGLGDGTSVGSGEGVGSTTAVPE